MAQNSKTQKGAQTAPKGKGSQTSKLSEINKAMGSKKAQAEVEKTNAGKAHKYIYPEAVATGDQRKKFRREARQQKKAWETTIAELEASNEKGHVSKLKEAKAEFDTWTSATYLPEDTQSN